MAAKTLKITTRAHQCGSKKWASHCSELRLVAVPDGAKTSDLRSKGVELIASSPVLVYWASGNQSSRELPASYYERQFREEAERLAAERPDAYRIDA